MVNVQKKTHISLPNHLEKNDKLNGAKWKELILLSEASRGVPRVIPTTFYKCEIIPKYTEWRSAGKLVEDRGPAALCPSAYTFGVRMLGISWKGVHLERIRQKVGPVCLGRRWQQLSEAVAVAEAAVMTNWVWEVRTEKERGWSKGVDGASPWVEMTVLADTPWQLISALHRGTSRAWMYHSRPWVKVWFLEAERVCVSLWRSPFPTYPTGCWIVLMIQNLLPKSHKSTLSSVSPVPRFWSKLSSSLCQTF